MSSNCEEDIRLKGVLESAFEGGGEGVRVRNGMCFDPSGHVRHRAFLGEVLELFGGGEHFGGAAIASNVMDSLTSLFLVYVRMDLNRLQTSEIP